VRLRELWSLGESSADWSHGYRVDSAIASRGIISPSQSGRVHRSSV